MCGCPECFYRSENLLRGGRRSVTATIHQLNEFTILPIEVTFADASNYLPDNGSDGRMYHEDLLAPMRRGPDLLSCTVARVAPRVTSYCVLCLMFHRKNINLRTAVTTAIGILRDVTRTMNLVSHKSSGLSHVCFEIGGLIYLVV